MSPYILRNLFRKHRSNTLGADIPKSSKRAEHRSARSGAPPKGEKMKQRWRGGTKHAEVNFRVLFRFLVSHLGCAWDRVLSELSRAIRSPGHRTVILEAVRSLVETSAREVGGSVCDSRGVPLPARKSIGESRFDRTLYVCPRTRCLQQVIRGG
jgi:hypothetical protein